MFMSTSEKRALLRLEVRAADPETEIFVINGQFRLIARGVGSLDALLEPGIYKLKSVAGLVTNEQHVILQNKDVVVSLPRLNFSSSAPLNKTAKTHEYHMAAADRESRNVHVSAGDGSWIFLFARDWTSKNRAPISWNPATDLTLIDENGNVLADFNTAGVRDLTPDPWAACNVKISPGVYRLRLLLPGDPTSSESTTLEQTIVASPGWQTQVFLLQTAYGAERQHRRADLDGASILLSRGMGFNQNRDDFRQTELARLGLMNRRQVLSNELRDLLRF